MGAHQFVYSFLPHEVPLVDSQVFQEAYKLNTPIYALLLEKEEIF
jgi:alpha-mannosidase